MEGKVVAITGGGSGIGLALAKLLAKRGAKISIADVSQPSLEKAAEAIKEAASSADEVLTCQCDVRNLSQVQSWLKQTVEKHGKLDGAANLAGVISRPGRQAGNPIIEQDEDNWDFIIGVNLTVCIPPFAIITTLLPSNKDYRASCTPSNQNSNS